MCRDINNLVSNKQVLLQPVLNKQHPYDMHRIVRWNNFSKKIKKFNDKISQFREKPKEAVNNINSGIYEKQYNDYNPKLKMHDPTKTSIFHQRYNIRFGEDERRAAGYAGTLLFNGI